MSSMLGPSQPFVGLRSYATGDHEWFFGRTQQSLSIYRLLCRVRFVAVVGNSGCGKSSTVRAGLLPLLAEETAAEGARCWRWWELRPGDSPIASLAETLNGVPKRDAGDIDREIHAARRERLEFVLRKSSLGLVDALRAIAVEPGVIPVIVIDQFEELLRLVERPGNRVARARREEAITFVQLLLEATCSADLPVRVVLTLRSDYLGDCALFQGLSEAISRGEFLLSALTRDQREQAIRGPIEKAGATIADQLVERLLNDGYDGHDLLPTLQHTLLRIWNHAADSGVPPRGLALADYQAIGDIDSVISRHAEELLAQPALKHLAMAVEQIFRALAQLDHQGRGVRRPLTYARLVAESAVPEADVRVVIDRFRAADCCFLSPLFVEGQSLAAEDIVELGHEALIRLWVRITNEEGSEQRGWLYEEAQDGRTYITLLNIARSGAGTGAAGGLPLDQASPRIAWWQSRPRTSAWADRYGGDLDSVEKLISDSTAQLQAAEQEKAKARFKWRIVLGGALLCGIALPFLVLLYWQSQTAAHPHHLEQPAESAAPALGSLQGDRAPNRGANPVAPGKQDPTGKPVLVAELQTDIAAAQAVRSDATNALVDSSRNVANAARAALAGNHRSRALLLSVAAMRIQNTPDARDVLLRGLQQAQRVPRSLSGHGAGIHSVALSPKGKLLASGGADKRVILWNTTKRKTVGAPLIGHKAPVSSLAFSPDASTLVSGAANELIFWDTRSGKQLGVVSMGDSNVQSRGRSDTRTVTRISFSSDGTLLAAGLGRRVLLFGVGQRRQLRTRLEGIRGHVLSVAFSPNGQAVAAGSTDGQLNAWDLSTGEPLVNWPRRNPGRVEVVAFSPDSNTLAAAGSDKSIILRDIATGKPIANLLNGHQDGISNLAFSRNGKTLASASLDQRVILWDVARKARRKTALTGREKRALSVAFSADGTALAYGGSDNRVAVWDLTESNNVLSTPLVGHSGRVTSVAFSPDSQLLASGGSDARIVLWDPTQAKRAGKPLRAHRSEVTSLAFSPDGKTLASSSVDSNAILWDLASRKPVGKPLIQDEGAIRSIAFSPDGTVLATGGDNKRVTLWNVASSQRTNVPRMQTDEKILSLAFSPDGKTLAAGGVDKSVKLWDARNGTRLGALPGQQRGQQRGGIQSIAFSPNGKIFAAGGIDQPVTLWDAINRRPLGDPLRESPKDVWNVAFSPDNKLIASTGKGGGVVLWDLASRKQLGGLLSGHRGVGSSVAFSPDGKFLASGGHDKRVILWDVNAEKWVSTACRVANRNLTRREWLRDVGQHLPYQRVCAKLPLPSE